MKGIKVISRDSVKFGSRQKYGFMRSELDGWNCEAGEGMEIDGVELMGIEGLGKEEMKEKLDTWVFGFRSFVRRYGRKKENCVFQVERMERGVFVSKLFDGKKS